jgi:hypothetical protein
VPPAPASADSKFILAAAQADKPRPQSELPGASSAPPPSRSSFPAGIALVVVLCALGTLAFVFRDKLFRAAQPLADSKAGSPTNTAKKAPVPRPTFAIPTNTAWSLSLSNAVVPEFAAVGSVRGEGFLCQRSTLQGGTLSLRQGKTWPPDLGVTINLFAKQGEELSGKTVEITPERVPPLPRVILRWKDDQDKPVTRNFQQGYAMRIVFGEAANGRMPGQIYLALPDENRSFVAGSFDAEIRKPAPAKPKQPKAAPAPVTR